MSGSISWNGVQGTYYFPRWRYIQYCFTVTGSKRRLSCGNSLRLGQRCSGSEGEKLKPNDPMTSSILCSQGNPFSESHLTELRGNPLVTLL